MGTRIHTEGSSWYRSQHEQWPEMLLKWVSVLAQNVLKSWKRIQSSSLYLGKNISGFWWDGPINQRCSHPPPSGIEMICSGKNSSSLSPATVPEISTITVPSLGQSILTLDSRLKSMGLQTGWVGKVREKKKEWIWELQIKTSVPALLDTTYVISYPCCNSASLGLYSHLGTMHDNHAPPSRDC